MSLKDLLPEGTFEELQESVHDHIRGPENSNSGIQVRCPRCGKMHIYSTADPFRPFCSERCKLLDLGAWASDEMKIEGPSLLDDDDAEYASDACFFEQKKGSQH